MSRTLGIEACRRAIRARNAELRAILHEIDPPLRDPSAGGPLAGVPYVLKDTWDVAGVLCTGGSWRYRERVPDRSSKVFDAIHATGAVLLGKSNLCDLAFSYESDNHLTGPVCNPHDVRRTSGGSTGGGAAAVAAGMANFDWGSDFGGSIRMPAAFCGVTGLRLSAASWPIPDDFFPRVPHLDLELHGMGPLARDVAGCRAVIQALRPHLAKADHAAVSPGRVFIHAPAGASAGEWPTFVSDAARALMAAGVAFEMDRRLPPPAVVGEAFDGYLASNFDAFLASDPTMPFLDGLRAVLLSVVGGARFDRRFHPNTAMLLGLLAAGHGTIYRDKRRARDRADRVREAMLAVWAAGGLVVAPTATRPAPRHGRAAFTRGLISFAKLGNLTDATALSIPFGRFPDRLPRGLQILGPPGSEAAVLELGARLEGQGDPLRSG